MERLSVMSQPPSPAPPSPVRTARKTRADAKTDEAKDTAWPLFYAGVRLFLRVYFTGFHRLRIRGQENVPLEGPIIVAPNHVSYYDPPLAGVASPRRLRSMAQGGLFDWRPLAWTIHRLGGVSVDRSTVSASAYKACLSILNHGGPILVFPEGRRGLGNGLQPFETGVARLALRTGAAIVPTTITGAFERWPRWRKRPTVFLGGPITVKFHPPLRIAKAPLRGEELRSAIEEINEALARPIRRRYEAYLRLQRRLGHAMPDPPPGFAVPDYAKKPVSSE
jgi:1-acyl-sn-glycerol-3-phosphate acyltransferase